MKQNSPPVGRDGFGNHFWMPPIHPTTYNKHVVSFPRARVLAVPFPQEAVFLALTSEMERAFSLAQVQGVPGATKKTVPSRFQSSTTPSALPAVTSKCSPSAGAPRATLQAREGGWSCSLGFPASRGEPGLCSGPRLGESGCPPSIHIPQAPN